MVLGGADDVRGAVGVAYVGLDGEGVDVVCTREGGCEVRGGRAGGVGGIAKDERCAFLGQIVGDGGTNACGCLEVSRLVCVRVGRLVEHYPVNRL